MSFKFNLEKLLNHKKIIKDVKERNFYLSKDDLQNEKNKLNKMYDYIDDSRKKVAENLLTGGTLINFLCLSDEFIEGEKKIIKKQNEVVRNKLQENEKNFEELKEASIEFKTLETLKKKKKIKYQKIKKKKEEKAINDNVVMNFKYKGQGEK